MGYFEEGELNLGQRLRDGVPTHGPFNIVSTTNELVSDKPFLDVDVFLSGSYCSMFNLKT